VGTERPPHPPVRVGNAAKDDRGKERGAVRIGLLGRFSVSVGDRKVDGSAWRLRKAAALVKLLALAPGYRLHREQAMNLLWPDLGLRAASNNLRQALHVARRTLHPDPAVASRYLSLSGEQLALCAEEERLWVDAEAFEEAAATARRSREPAAYRAAIELYSGELLPEDRYEEWAESRRQQLRRTFLSLLIELAGLYEERGVEEELEPAIQALRRVLAEEPTNEEAHVGLMRLYARPGRSREALRQYGRLSEALSSGLGAEPSAAARALREEIAAGRFPAGPTTQPAGPPMEEAAGGGEGQHNLPAQRTAFVGREREMLEVKRQLAMTRLLSLIGAGGSGKTRLALEVARDLVGVYPDGVWLVELAPLRESALVPQELVRSLGVKERPGQPLIDTLIDVLRAKRVLLVLDNCEHLVEAAARLVNLLLDSCPRLRIIATSREVLAVAGEVVWRVPALSLPDPQLLLPTARELEGYESVRLFVDRARQRDSALALTPRNAPAVAEICRWLEGMPLAIELAAARIGTLSVQQISERLVDSLKLLTHGDRATPRQQTLRGALDWSYELLSEDENRLFERLSTFVGGWALEAAEVVASGDGIEQGDILELLSGLIDKSLAVAESTADGVLRYRMLEPVRQYAQEKLEGRGEADAVRRRHAGWYLAFAEEAERVLIGPSSLGWLNRLETEHDNLRAALRYFIDRGDAERGLRLAGALGEFWRVRGHLREGLRWLEAVLVADGGSASPARVKVLTHAGWIAWERLDFERSTAFSEEALALSREFGDKEGAAAALDSLGMVAIYDQMRADEAWALFEESLALKRELGDAAGIGRTLQRMGLISVVRHDFERATTLYEECLELAQKTDDKHDIAFALWLGGLAALGLRNYRLVRTLCGEGLNLARQCRYPHAVALMTHVLAASAGAQGQPVRSARLWGAAESLLDKLGFSLGPAERHYYTPYITAARAGLGEEAWKAAWAKGKAMPQEEALEYALSEEEPVLPAPDPKKTSVDVRPVAITPREEQVAVLVARGLTNRQIAEELFVSERTVENHVSKILRKLGLASRAQIAAWTTELSLLAPDTD
jgi:predicted ATPase/DNA-binding SARP family transcriptional activator/DNA-binding CsgD family transcriptional regulator